MRSRERSARKAHLWSRECKLASGSMHSVQAGPRPASHTYVQQRVCGRCSQAGNSGGCLPQQLAKPIANGGSHPERRDDGLCLCRPAGRHLYPGHMAARLARCGCSRLLRQFRSCTLSGRRRQQAILHKRQAGYLVAVAANTSCPSSEQQMTPVLLPLLAGLSAAVWHGQRTPNNLLSSSCLR